MRQKLIPILDNGHGQETKGKRSPVWADGTQLFEFEFNRDIVKRIKSMCDYEGIKAIVLVPEQEDISLPERCVRANNLYVDNGGRCVVFSIHANAGGGTGYEVYTSKGQTKADDYATILFNEMKKYFSRWKMRTDYTDGDPDKESQFYILKHTAAPAILSENFFMDNEKDCKRLMEEDFRERIAVAHFEAIKKICLTI